MTEKWVHRCPGCGALAPAHSAVARPDGWAKIAVDWGSVDFRPAYTLVCSECARKVEALVQPPLLAEEPRRLGDIAPPLLWAKVRARQLRRGLTIGDLAGAWGCPNVRVHRWSLGDAPCAATLLAAERWVRACGSCAGSGQIAAHPDLIGSSRIPCGSCGGSGVSP